MPNEDRLTVSIEHKECVVDSHSESNHRGQCWRECGNVKEQCDYEDEHLTCREPNNSNHNRHTGRNNRTECNEQNNNCNEDSKEFT